MTARRRTTWTGASVLALAALALAACGANRTDEPADRAGPAAQDTARGIVSVTGADPATGVTLRTGAGPVALHGPVADTLRLASGVDVWVAGDREATGALTVRAFRVRTVDGVPATNGLLEIDGSAAILVTAAGERVRFAPVPPGLRALEGRHVWVAARAGEEPQAWGALDDTW